MFKKGLSILLAIVMVISVPMFCFANEEESEKVDNPVVLDFGECSYIIDDLSVDCANIVKTEDGPDRITYEVTNIMNPTIVDTISVEFASGKSARSANPNTRPTKFTKTKSINTNTGKNIIDIVFIVTVDYYESGSFRAFYRINGTNLLLDGDTPMELVNVQKEAHSATGSFPTNQINFSYSGNLRTTINSTISAQLGAELRGAGFSVGGSSSSSRYYYKIISETGRFKVM